MIPPPGPGIKLWVWQLAIYALVGWNATLAKYANPFSLTQGYDGAQYQLLARNRLAGSYHESHQAHTVRDEGSHPMWRPGLVWLLEGTAHLTGSVSQAAWMLSTAGTTLFEVIMLWIAWRCFGRTAWVILLAAFFLPFHWSAIFLSMALGQGPEPWAAALVLLGWAIFLKSLDGNSAILAIVGGVAIGGADWFRTGNLLMFAAPWGIFLLAGLLRRSRVELRQSLAMLGGFVAITLLGSWLFASPVNKTIANLWGNLVEHHGLQVVQETESGSSIQYLAGLHLAPGGLETYYDYIVRASGQSEGEDFWKTRRGEIVPLYVERLTEACAGGFTGLRLLAGESTVVFALLGIVLALTRRDVATLALAAGFFAHYFGPVVLLRGDKPSHYLFVALPLLALVAAGCVAHIINCARAKLPEAWHLSVVAWVAVVPVVVLATGFHRGGTQVMREEHTRAQEDMIALDRLELQGKKLATRGMAWFVDRDIQAVLCPYAEVRELENYTVHHGLDGILLRAQEKHLFSNAMPYASFDEFERAMSRSEVFAPARISGAWRWFPVRKASHN